MKRVAQYDIETGEKIAEFENCCAAAVAVFHNKLATRLISLCAVGMRDSAYGYVWKYI